MSHYSQAASWLVNHAVEHKILNGLDATWAYNRVLEAVGAFGPAPCEVADDAFTLDSALEVLAGTAVENGQVEDSATGRDRAAMRVCGAIMPAPSQLAAHFNALSLQDPQAATNWFYGLCCDVNYVRRSAIARNLEWTTNTAWGNLQITINKSKPEKDPRDIAAAGAAPTGEAYPPCQLCVTNEGYSGRPAANEFGTHPARQNLRIMPIELGGEPWGFQFSPYAYFYQHCIAMSAEHRPMHVDRTSLTCLLDFVDLFPHYFVGSNADLPIVGGSILSHDHFQGGMHTFPMEEAPVVQEVPLASFASVTCGVVNWPLTVLRLSCENRGMLLEAAVYVLDAWRAWSDEACGIVARDADGTLHNTITPICRMRGGKYELDLALRCNVTSDEHPLGVFHPHEDKWHVKKENIGLIEVMGLAILPPRLEAEIDAGNITRDEIGRVFAGVLEDAGVYKWDEAGREGLNRFLAQL